MSWQLSKFVILKYILCYHIHLLYTLSNIWLICENKYVCHPADSCSLGCWRLWRINKSPLWLKRGAPKPAIFFSPGDLFMDQLLPPFGIESTYHTVPQNHRGANEKRHALFERSGSSSLKYSFIHAFIHSFIYSFTPWVLWNTHHVILTIMLDVAKGYICEQNFLSFKELYSLSRAATTKYHRLVDFHNGNLLSHNAGDWNLGIKVWAGLAPSEDCEGRMCSRTLSLAYRWPSPPRTPLSSSLCVCLCLNSLIL